MIQGISARRLARLAGVASAALPAHALAETPAPAEPATIIVTGERSDAAAETPATSETVTAEQLRETTTVINAEDSLRYLPSLLVRKRHIGDTQAPLATRTSGVGSSARSLIYADGMLLSALIGNNNSTASPRWGMVAPEEISQVEVLYGPFSAAYAGNSIGAVVNISTRFPDNLEATASTATSVQQFSQYATKGTYPAYQLAGSIGDRIGPFRLFLSANHVTSNSQPVAYITVARPTSMSSAGVPVTGPIEDLNRIGSPIYVIGAGGLEDQRQDNLKLKLGLEISPSLALTYRGGIFLNDTNAEAETFLGGDIYAGMVNVDGHAVTIPASAFSNNVYRLNERHFMHGLVANGELGKWAWQAAGSLYDFDKNVQRIPSGALPAARSGGPGTIVKLDGTGWKTFDLSVRRGRLSLGGHADWVRLEQERFSTNDWRHGEEGALTQASRGRTRTVALWSQFLIPVAESIGLTVGGRYEWWRADQGFNFSASPSLSVHQPEQYRQGFSPKASLRWEPAEHWSVTLSAGQAFRFPTVQELYQAISTGPTITVPNPNLKPERARSEELAIEWRDAKGHIRLSLFNEAIRNALISQSAPLLPGSTTLFNYVQNIPKDQTRGIELAFDRQGVLTPEIDVSGSATLVDPEIVSDPVFPEAEGKDIPQVPRRRATLVVTWHPDPVVSLTLAGRHASKSYGTINNSDVVHHTYQGFDGYTVIDARANFRISEKWEAAFGVENVGNDKYYLFHPFPQRSFTAEVHMRL